jgi:rhodanese-related sulfurtransferase
MHQPLNLAQFENENDTGAYILDFRTANEFIDGFVPGSFYMSRRFLNAPFCKDVIAESEVIIIIADKNTETRSISELESHHYQNIAGWLKGGFETWYETKNKLDVVISIEADELMMDMKYDDPQVIDIRSADAYRTMHLETAENIPVENLLFNLDQLPKEGTFYLYCEDGDLSLSVISSLKNQGLHNYYHVKGGFQALKKNEAKMALVI